MPTKRRGVKPKDKEELPELEETTTTTADTTTTTTTTTTESEDTTEVNNRKRKQKKDEDGRQTKKQKEGDEKEEKKGDKVEIEEEKEEMKEDGKEEEKTSASDAKEKRKRVKVPGSTKKKVDMKEFKFNWKDMNFIGVELDNLEEIKAQKWKFRSLDHAFKEGVLSNVTIPVYLFMSAQPVETTTTDAEGKVSIDIFNVPYIVAIVCDVRPSAFDSVAVTSIQLGEERIGTLAHSKLSWGPYKPKAFKSESEISSNFFVLQWSGRKVNLKSMDEEQKSNYSMTMPYIALPQVVADLGTIEERLANVKNVTFKYTSTVEVDEVIKKGKGKGKTVKVFKVIDIVWDKEVMRTSIDIDGIIEDNGLPESEHPLIVAALKVAFEEARKKEQEKYDKEMAKINQFSEKEKQNLRNIKCYKFYPEKDGVDIDKNMVPTINRYYGNAYEIFPKPKPSSLNNADTEERMKANNGNEEKKDIFTFSSDKLTPPTITGFQFKPTTTSSDSNKFFSQSTQSSSNSSNNTVFTWPVASTTTDPDNNNNTTTTATAPQTGGGFFFNPTAVQAPKSTASNNNDNWKCKACETFNPNSATRCGLCMSNR